MPRSASRRYETSALTWLRRRRFPTIPSAGTSGAPSQILALPDFDLLVVCLAGWIPTHTVIDVITPFRHKPMVLWGLTGEQVGGRLVTTADQAGTSALRHPLKALGFRFKYVYDTPDAPYCAAEKVAAYARVAHAAARLRTAKVGMIGYRDMGLYGTLADIPSLRRVVGPDVEIVDLLEIAQGMQVADADEVRAAVAHAQAQLAQRQAPYGRGA